MCHPTPLHCNGKKYSYLIVLRTTIHQAHIPVHASYQAVYNNLSPAAGRSLARIERTVQTDSQNYHGP